MIMKNISSKIGRANSSGRRGFTLVELLLVLTILAILAAIVLPSMVSRREQANIAAAKTEIASFSTALDMFEVDNGYFPKGAGGLQCLMIKPRDAQDTWRGPYLKKNKIPLDPWQRPYVYENPGRHNPTSFDLFSRGKDGDGGNNAIGNWIPD
jgi:general secretion pathway protein G